MERVWVQMPEIGGHWGRYKNLLKSNFLAYMKLIMRSTAHGGYGVTIFFCSQARLPVVGLDVTQLNCWPGVSHLNPKQAWLLLTQRVAFSKLTAVSHYWGQHPFIEHEEAKLVPTWRRHSYVLDSFLGEESLLEPKREMWKTKSLSYNLSCTRNMLGQWLHIMCGNSSLFPILLEHHSMGRIPSPKLLK